MSLITSCIFSPNNAKEQKLWESALPTNFNMHSEEEDFGFLLEQKPLRTLGFFLYLNNLLNFTWTHQYKWLRDKEPTLNLLCLSKATLHKSDNTR